MSIRIVCVPPPPKKLRDFVLKNLKAGHNVGRSASGASLSVAVEWYEENRIPYVIFAIPGAGYYVRQMKEGES